MPVALGEMEQKSNVRQRARTWYNRDVDLAQYLYLAIAAVRCGSPERLDRGPSGPSRPSAQQRRTAQVRPSARARRMFELGIAAPTSHLWRLGNEGGLDWGGEPHGVPFGGPGSGSRRQRARRDPQHVHPVKCERCGAAEYRPDALEDDKRSDQSPMLFRLQPEPRGGMDRPAVPQPFGRCSDVEVEAKWQHPRNRRSVGPTQPGARGQVAGRRLGVQSQVVIVPGRLQAGERDHPAQTSWRKVQRNQADGIHCVPARPAR